MIENVFAPGMNTWDGSSVLTKWLVSDGDFVSKEQPIAKFEDEEFFCELPALHSGKIELMIREGNKVYVNDLIAKIHW